MGIEDDIALLGRVPTFAVLGDEALKILAFGAESRQVPEGNFLFAEGESADAAFVIQSGSFALTKGGNAVAPTPAGRGVLLGAPALLTRTTHSLTATAQTRATVLRISRSLFLRMLEGYPDAAERLRRNLVRRANETEAELRAVRNRLAQLDENAAPA